MFGSEARCFCLIVERRDLRARTGPAGDARGCAVYSRSMPSTGPALDLGYDTGRDLVGELSQRITHRRDLIGYTIRCGCDMDLLRSKLFRLDVMNDPLGQEDDAA